MGGRQMHKHEGHLPRSLYTQHTDRCCHLGFAITPRLESANELQTKVVDIRHIFAWKFCRFYELLQIYSLFEF
jgi:hypothetical protein